MRNLYKVLLFIYQTLRHYWVFYRKLQNIFTKCTMKSIKCITKRCITSKLQKAEFPQTLHNPIHPSRQEAQWNLLYTESEATTTTKNWNWYWYSCVVVHRIDKQNWIFALHSKKNIQQMFSKNVTLSQLMLKAANADKSAKKYHGKISFFNPRLLLLLVNPKCPLFSPSSFFFSLFFFHLSGGGTFHSLSNWGFFVYF